jgi:sugar lactone lactonase YvrE
VPIGVALVLVLLIGALPAQGRGKPPPVKVSDAQLLHRGSVFDGPNGLFFGPNDRLYVASVNGGELSVLDPRSGHISERLGSDVGVLSPDDVTVAPDGTVYWTNIVNGTVGKLSPDGSSKTQFVAFGVNPITISDDGRLFVGLAFFGDGLYELDPDLTAPPQVLIPPSSPPLGINGFDFGPDGMLYAPRMFTGEIVRIDVDSATPTPQVVAGGFTFPTAVKFDSKGQLHLAANGDAFRLDVATGARTVLLDTDGDTDNLAFDSKDRLFVSMLSNNTVLEVLPSGVARLLNPPGVGNPGGVAVLPNGSRGRCRHGAPCRRGGEDVYVADFYTLDRIDGRTGKFERTLPQFSPTSVNVDATGQRLILSDPVFAGAVQVFDPASGGVVASYPVPGAFNAVPFDGDIAISQLGFGVVDTTGSPLMSGLFLPTGMASDGENLYVSDWATGIIWWLPAGGVQVPIAFGLANPEGLELRDGELLVVEEGTKQLIGIDLASGTRTVIAEGLPIGRQHAASPFVAPFVMLTDVAVGPSGDVYVTADDPNAVYVLRG